MSKQFKTLLGLGLVAVLALSAIPALSSGKGSAPATTAKTVTIQVGDNWFKPKDTTVPAGTTIVWKWVGKVAHTASSDSIKKFSSKLIKSGTYTQKLTTKGTYHIYCKVHPEHKGTITVK